MPNYRRADIKAGTYFFTVVSFRRQKILCHEKVRSALRHAVRETQKIYPFVIDAWVLLPDHLHCIWRLPQDDANFSLCWAMVKRFVTKQCGSELRRNELMNASKYKRKEGTVWQRRFWEHHIRDERDDEKHIDYIHYNPAKHGDVNNVMDWPYSTFHRYQRAGLYPSDWGGVNNDSGVGQYKPIRHQLYK